LLSIAIYFGYFSLKYLLKAIIKEKKTNNKRGGLLPGLLKPRTPDPAIFPPFTAPLLRPSASSTNPNPRNLVEREGGEATASSDDGGDGGVGGWLGGSDNNTTTCQTRTPLTQMRRGWEWKREGGDDRRLWSVVDGDEGWLNSGELEQQQ